MCSVDVVAPAHEDTVNAGSEWCEVHEAWFPVGTHAGGF